MIPPYIYYYIFTKFVIASDVLSTEPCLLPSSIVGIPNISSIGMNGANILFTIVVKSIYGTIYSGTVPFAGIAKTCIPSYLSFTSSAYFGSVKSSVCCVDYVIALLEYNNY